MDIAPVKRLILESNSEICKWSINISFFFTINISRYSSCISYIEYIILECHFLKILFTLDAGNKI